MQCFAYRTLRNPARAQGKRIRQVTNINMNYTYSAQNKKNITLQSTKRDKFFK